MRKAIIIILCALGLIVGVIVGEQFSGTPGLSWLGIGGQIGFQEPVVLNLGMLTLTLGFWCKINIGGVIGLVLFAILSKWVTGWLKV